MLRIICCKAAVGCFAQSCLIPHHAGGSPAFQKKCKRGLRHALQHLKARRLRAFSSSHARTISLTPCLMAQKEEHGHYQWQELFKAGSDLPDAMSLLKDEAEAWISRTCPGRCCCTAEPKRRCTGTGRCRKRLNPRRPATSAHCMASSSRSQAGVLPGYTRRVATRPEHSGLVATCLSQSAGMLKGLVAIVKLFTSCSVLREVTSHSPGI